MVPAMISWRSFCSARVASCCGQRQLRPLWQVQQHGLNALVGDHFRADEFGKGGCRGMCSAIDVGDIEGQQADAKAVLGQRISR